MHHGIKTIEGRRDAPRLSSVLLGLMECPVQQDLSGIYCQNISTTSSFAITYRYIVLEAHTLTTEELVEQGMAFSVGGLVITPLMGLAITVLIGAFFLRCVSVNLTGQTSPPLRSPQGCGAAALRRGGSLWSCNLKTSQKTTRAKIGYLPKDVSFYTSDFSGFKSKNS